MKKENDRFEDLLARLDDGECGSAERSELAELCLGDPERCRAVVDHLTFSELLHQACMSEHEGLAFEEQLTKKLSNEVDEFDEQLAQLLSGEQQGKWFSALKSDPVLADRLRDELEFDDLISQAASPVKSEEAFIQALSTRMWAEVEEDHFVEDLSSKIIEMDVAQTNRISSISLASHVDSVETTWWSSLSKPLLAAAAAVSLAGLMLWNFLPNQGMGKVVAESGNVSWDSDYGKTPVSDGALGKGLYRLESGVVHLRFVDGAEMSVEGPAEFEIKGEREVEVHSGLVVAREATGNKGDFIFGARGLDLVGAGSTVGVDVRDGGAPELTVLNGGAEAHVLHGGVKRRLHDFEAVRADLERNKLVDIPFNPHPFSSAWELMSGVAANTGTVEVALPGSQSRKFSGGNRVRVSVERDQFELADNEQLEVDTLSKGHFVAMNANQAGEILSEKGQLRSYLLELKPGGDGSSESTLEASMTFDHPVVGVIFSENRLTNSDELLGSGSTMDSNRMKGEAGVEGQVLLSDDGRTVNLVLPNEGSDSVSGSVRILVALN